MKERLETKSIVQAGQCRPAGYSHVHTYVSDINYYLYSNHTKYLEQTPRMIFIDVISKEYLNQLYHVVQFASFALNYCSGIFQISQLSIRSGAHKRFHRFLDLLQFLTAIFRTLWRHLATKMRTV